MATIQELMAAGFSALQATAIATGPAATVVAAGASQGTAPQISTPAVILGTGAAAGVTLPPAGGQSEVTVYNNSGNTQNIYPSLGQTINALTANTPITLATAKTMTFLPVGNGWLAQLGA